MPQVGIATQFSRPEVRPAAQAKSSNAALRLVRGIWFWFRNLAAEFVAFPIVLRRTSEGLVVTADLPGLQKDEVTVEISHLGLVIDVEPKRAARETFLRAGRRLIVLHDDIEFGLAKAELKNGLLTVTLPTSERKRSRKVPLECGDAPEMPLPQATCFRETSHPHLSQ
jgi:HSP20 family molecular chaperone IbpA